MKEQRNHSCLCCPGPSVESSSICGRWINQSVNFIYPLRLVRDGLGLGLVP